MKAIPPQFDKMRRLYLGGLSTYAVGRKLDLTAGAVRLRLKRAGVKLRQRKNYPPNIRRQSKTALPKKPCLRCREPFRPAHKFNRLCPRCAHYIRSNSSSLAPGW